MVDSWAAISGEKDSLNWGKVGGMLWDWGSLHWMWFQIGRVVVGRDGPGNTYY